MEEARQHPALVEERRLFAVVYIAAVLALFIGILAQLVIGGRSFQIAVVLFCLCRAVISLWQFARPKKVWRLSASRALAALWGVLWLAFGIGISLPLWAY